MDNKQLTIVQIGCGVVGNAYIQAYQKVGCKVIGIEASQTIINNLRDKVEMYHINQDLSHLRNIDFIMISICTPLKDNRLDLTYLFNSLNNVSVLVKNNPDTYVILRSTVPPTTTRSYKKKLEELVGHNVTVLFQPEFLRAVSAKEDALKPWSVVLGVDEDTKLDKLYELYTKFIEKSKIEIHNIEEAEILKDFHNTFNATKISAINQFYLICEGASKEHNIKLDCDKICLTLTKTCEGIRNPKYGMKPGHAYYGSCLPKDSAELAALEKKYGLDVPFFDSVVKVNNVMKARDKAEVLNGDYHMKFDQLKS